MSTWLLIVFLCQPAKFAKPCALYPVTISPLTYGECVQMHHNYSQDANYRGGKCVKLTTI